MKREAPAPGIITIPAATLPEFIARAVESSGTIRSASQCGERDRGAFQHTARLARWSLQRGVS
jgi:hypothetical protein